jgi:hypothetical protein
MRICWSFKFASRGMRSVKVGHKRASSVACDCLVISSKRHLRTSRLPYSTAQLRSPSQTTNQNSRYPLTITTCFRRLREGYAPEWKSSTAADTGTGAIRPPERGHKGCAAMAAASGLRDLPEQVWASVCVSAIYNEYFGNIETDICLRRYKIQPHFHGLNPTNGYR